MKTLRLLPILFLCATAWPQAFGPIFGPNIPNNATSFVVTNILNGTNAAGILENLSAPRYVSTFADLAACGTDGPNLVAILGHTTVGDGGEGVFQRVASSTYTTNTVTVMNGVGCQWARVFDGPLPARAAGTGNWASDVNVCFADGLTNVLVDANTATTVSNVSIPTLSRLEFSPGATVALGTNQIKLVGDDSQFSGGGRIFTCAQAGNTNWAAIQVYNGGSGYLSRARVENFKLTGDSWTQDGAGLEIRDAKYVVVHNVAISLFRGTDAACLRIRSDNAAGVNNCTFVNVSVGDGYHGVQFMVEPDAGGPYTAGYSDFYSLHIGGCKYGISSTCNDYAVTNALQSGNNTFHGLFHQLDMDSLRSIYKPVGGPLWKFSGFRYDGTGDTTYVPVEIGGNTAGDEYDGIGPDDVSTSSTGGVKVMFGTNPGTTVYTGSTDSQAAFRGNSGSRNMHLTVGAGQLTNTVGFGWVTLAGRQNNTTAFNWSIAPNGTSLKHLGFLAGANSSFSSANSARVQFYYSGGIGMHKVTSDPGITLATNEMAFYAKSNSFGVTPFIRNSDGIFSVPFYLGHGATTPTIGLEPGNMWISNAVLPTVRAGSDFIALGTVDVGTASITATNSVVLTTSNKTRYLLDPTSNLTLNGTGQISDGYPGQVIYLYTASGEANTVTFQDQGTIAGSNIRMLSGTTSRTMAAGRTWSLIFDGTDWLELGFQVLN